VRKLRWSGSVAALVLVAFVANAPADGQKAQRAVPAGSAKLELDVGGARLEVFTYKPRGFKDGPMILVFHGVGRNADTYRDSARGLGDRLDALIVAPLFDAKRFPGRLYQHGGLLTREGKAAPKDQWTWQLVPRLAAKVRQLEGRPDMPYALLGHSAGGQFLVRLAGFLKTDATRVVAANPGTHLFPSQDFTYPFGYGGLPAELSSEAVLRRYLAQPLTIFLGTADNRKDDYLDDSAGANRQGDSRHQRGLNAFRSAEQLAKRKGWDFNWRLVEAAGVGHNARAMFADPACETALSGKKPGARP
jgi:dienelactone hydrolase